MLCTWKLLCFKFVFHRKVSPLVQREVMNVSFSEEATVICLQLKQNLPQLGFTAEFPSKPKAWWWWWWIITIRRVHRHRNGAINMMKTLKISSFSTNAKLLSLHHQSRQQCGFNRGYDISISSLYCGVNAQWSSQSVLGWSAEQHRQSIYLVACLCTQGSLCFSRPPALSHDLPGREQQPTGESVDTVRDQKHNTLGLLWVQTLGGQLQGQSEH